MSQPLCSVALLYMGGILAGEWLHPPLWGLFAFSFLVAVAALGWEKGRIYLLGALLVLAGWTNTTSHTAIVSPNDLRLLLGAEPQAVTVRGVLCASPTPRIFVRDNKELWHSAVALKVSAVCDTSGWHDAYGKVIATVSGILSSNFFNGQSVEVAGAIHSPRGPQAEGLFDARTYYRHQGIYYQLQTSSTNNWGIVAKNPALPIPLSDRFSRWARKILALGLPGEDKPLRLIWTLALDWKAPMTVNVEEPFMRAGTYHIFAVDGLRIGLLAGIGIGLLRALQLPRALCGALVIPIIWFYASLTGWPASAVRAAIMMSIVILGWASRRPGNLLNSLFAAAFIILLWDPKQLFQGGFQLSFLVVFCIGLLLPVFRKNAFRWVFKGDPFLPATLQKQWPPPLRDMVAFAIDVCAVSLAAWLGSVPLSAADFHLFTPVSVPANILVVPATALALMSSIGSLLTGAWWPGLAVLFNHSSWFLMKCIIALSGWAAQLPGASFNVSTPSPITFALYYLAVLALCTGWIFRSRFKGVASAAIAVLGACWLVQWGIDRKTACLHFLPLNGGAATFVDHAGLRGACLFDCGNPASAEFVVKPFLCAQGINTLDSFCLTVGHQQFGGGARVVLTNFSVAEVVLGPAQDRSSAYREVTDEIKQTSRWQALHSGDNVGQWSVLHPPLSSHFTQADDNALVFWREINGHSILLLSTLGRAGQDSLMEHYQNLRADIVVASLPARDEPLSEPLLGLLHPKLIIVVDSELPATRRASSQLRDRLARHNAPVVYCHDEGAVKLNLGRNQWSLQNASGERLFYE
ncbi:MAG TPA: ComEC/Rec2 family competence protein [Candidatus Saccharimonadales bacterium]|nr:ComEC/Rec2 family competence protein [Candidatus Saccharimonadales bacterium]